MPDDKRTDPFKPLQPSIPGVPASSATRASDARERASGNSPLRNFPPQLIWLIAGAVAFCVIGVALLLWLRNAASQAAQPAEQPAAAAQPVATEAPKSTQNLPLGPGPVATAEELAKPWASKRFLFRDPVTSEQIPAMVVRLPEGSYWAFSLREPFGNCDLEYVTDLEKLRTGYNFHASHPMVVDTCNRTVYDLQRYGSASDGGLVRGDVVQGSGIRPPMAIEVRIEGKQLVTVRME